MKIFQTKQETASYWKEVNLISQGKASISITVDPSIHYQEHIGFGGAFTEAAAYTISLAPPDVRQEAIRAYFSDEGLRYNLGRTSIHSCDFSLESYTYVKEDDASLDSFSLQREEQYVIPLIKEAQALSSEPLLIMSSPWSPPAFMKTNGHMCHGGSLKPEFASAWASYFIRYIEEMTLRGVPIWAVSVQNEPAAIQVWESCIYSASEERDFVKHHLGPALASMETKLMVWDHNRDELVERATTILSDPETSKYVWGVANHWYVSEDFSALDEVHRRFPDKYLMFTEGTVEYGIYGSEPRWENGEHYGRNIIGDFSNWSRGWIDWNLFLNEEGGPNHVSNFCEAPIMYDRTTESLIYNISYYYIGHFSRYIERGAKRIHLESSLPSKVVAVAYQNPNHSIVLVLQNESNDDITIDYHGVYTIAKRSITTFIKE